MDMRPAAPEADAGSDDSIAIAALNFLASDGKRLERFLSVTGLGPHNLRRAASEANFLSAARSRCGRTGARRRAGAWRRAPKVRSRLTPGTTTIVGSRRRQQGLVRRRRLDVPAAGRGGDFVGRRLGFHDLELRKRVGGRGERVQVQLGGDLVAFLGRPGAALRRGKRKPQPRLAKILRLAEAAGVQYAPIELAVLNAERPRLAKPLRRVGVVWLFILRLGVCDREVMGGARVASLGDRKSVV